MLVVRSSLAARITPTSAASVAAIKKAVLYGYNRDPHETDAYEQKHFAALFGPEQSQSMHTFLKEQGRQ
jgi:enoyl-CoA hydratase/carnithine racemase